MAKPVTAQLHRFGEKVAMYLGSGQTVYMDPKTAIAIAKSLNACARNIKDQPSFAKSEFKTVEFKFDGAM